MVIGAALSGVVNSLVNDVIMPPIGFALGGVDFAELKFVLGVNDNGEEVAIRWGLLVNAIIVFVVVAFVVYVLSKIFIPPKEEEPTKACPFCGEPNLELATRCRACTSEI